MGDPTMKPLPSIEQVIDYVYSDVRSDWMDVFGLASCRFQLGNVSGPLALSQVVGVPTAAADSAPMRAVLSTKRDIWTPKLYWSDGEDRYLTFAEVLTSPLARMNRTELFDNAGISLVDNTPEENRDLAVEVMDRLEGDLHYSAEDERLQEIFKSLLEPEPEYVTSARVGRDFLRKYSWLLGDETSRAGAAAGWAESILDPEAYGHQIAT